MRFLTRTHFAGVCLALVGGLGASLSAAAPAPLEARCAALKMKVIDVGEYRPLAAADAARIENTDHEQVNGAMEFVEPTQELTLRLGAMFGFTWLATGFEPGVTTPLGVFIDHPLMESPGRGRSNGIATRFPVISQDGRYRHALAWQLTEPHELVAGEWVLRLTCGERVLAEERFRLVEAGARRAGPPAAPSP